ncbi:hypothetical protein BH11BAC3_BH11BAC3_28230 [soil metagenome]
MKSVFSCRILFLISFFIGVHFSSLAQNVAPAASQGPDTLRIIQIINGDRLREKQIDSATIIQTLAGHVILKEGLTLFYCDSAVIDKRTNILEAFGNIHINQNDSIHTYAQNLRYIGNDRMAFLKKDVRLTDNKGTLYTQDLDYDLKSSIGNYRNGGRVVNGKTVLTSTEGIYYAETKDVYFKKNVHLVDPKYDIRNDTLLYNTQTQVSSWNTPTVIKSKNGGDIYSSSGVYDLKNGKAFFGNRTVIKDSSRTYVSDNSAYDEITGIAQLEGNAVIKDSVNGYTVTGGQIFLNKNDNSFLATRKPVLIFKGDGNDSTFIAADTLFSGVEHRDKYGNLIAVEKDTIKSKMVVNVNDSTLAFNKNSDSIGLKRGIDSVNMKSFIRKMPAGQLPTDSVVIAKVMVPKDSTGLQIHHVNLDSRLVAMRNVKVVSPKKVPVQELSKSIKKSKNLPLKKLPDSTAVVKIPSTPDSSLVNNDSHMSDSLFVNKTVPDSLGNIIAVEDSSVIKDSVMDNRKTIAAADTTIRFFIAFHHVRIFNDSLQSVCDSLYYSSLDSIFRLFQNPLVFSNNSQISGDTIYMYTKNKKAERIYVFENGIVINKASEKMYNQIAGRTLNGYFKDGEMDYMRAKGSPAESVYYPQDEDSAYIGMNRSKGDVIDIYFLNKEVHKIKFINDVDGTLYPMRQIPEDQKYLKNYKWEEMRRPKNKLELFE